MAPPPGQPAPLPMTSDEQLLAAIADGDLRALGELYDRHAATVERYFVRLGVASADVDDLVQATFLEITRAAPRFDPARSTRSWLFGVANVMVLRHRRSLGRAAARLLRWITVTPLDHPATPAEVCAQAETTRALEAAFARLSPKKRDVFVLVTLEGLTGEEAARALGIPLKTLWTRLHYARRELRDALEEDAP